MYKRRVVITGVGTINPLGKNISEYFANLEAGVSGAGMITRFDASNTKTKIAAEIKDYNAEDYFDRKEARRIDIFTQYALISTKEAVEDSGILQSEIDKDRMGVIWGSGIGGIDALFNEIQEYCHGDGNPHFSPFFILRMISNMAAGHISLKYGCMGPSFSTTSACASSSHALISAVDQIRLGRADIMITGGSEGAITLVGVAGFNAMMALSTRNDDPKTASRPYDKNRDGFLFGEGSGTLIIEEYEHAVKRGAKIYAEIVGGGENADAFHVTAPHPEGDGAYKCMMYAIKDAGIEPSQIDYINTHGTSTPTGDVPELKAIERVMGDSIYDVNISATKSMTGHLLGAAGVIEILACIMTIQNGIIPPTINNFELDPAIDPKLNLTLNKAQKRDVNYAMSNTFGFGGQNSAVILKKI